MPTEIERLYREHRAGLVRLVERELRDHDDAEDVVQTAFLDAQRALERGTIPNNPPAWLAAIALNAGRRLRRRRLNAEPLEDYAVQEAARMPEIREALASLPQSQRAAVVYRDVAGLSYDETAVKLGTTVNAVTMLLHRGRSKLRHVLGIAVGGFGLWPWVRRAGMPQAALAKGSAAFVVAAGLATTGMVAAREVAPVGAADATSAPAAAPVSGKQAPAATTAVLASTRRGVRPAGGSTASAVPVSTQASSGTATTAPVLSSTSQSEPSPTTLSVSTVSLPTTVAATVGVSTPITTVAVTTPTVTVPTVTSVTATTPIVTVTLPIP